MSDEKQEIGTNATRKIEKFGYNIPSGIDKKIIEITDQIWAREREWGVDKIRVSSKLYAKAMEVATDETNKNFMAEYSKDEIAEAFKHESGPLYSTLSDYWCHVLEEKREKLERRFNVDIDHDGDFIGIMYIGQSHVFKGFVLDEADEKDIEIELKDDINDQITLIREICRIMMEPKPQEGE